MSTAFNYDPWENSDWNFARAIRFSLRNKIAEFSISAYSTTFSLPVDIAGIHLTAPNRDYPYEGFLALTQGENWKFLDSLAFGLLREGEPFTLRPTRVSASPQLLVYFYEVEFGVQREGSLRVTYWLSEGYETACLNVDYQLTLSESNTGAELVAAPLVDIRHMYAQSKADAHRVVYGRPDEEAILRLEKGGHNLSLVNAWSKNLRVETAGVRMPWFYKLGSGYRANTPVGIVFRGESRDLLIPAIIYAKFEGEHVTLRLIAQGGATPDLTRTPTSLTDEVRNEERRFSALRRLFPLRSTNTQIYNSILARIWAFSRFCMQVAPPQAAGKFLVPEAGGWWFRTPWLRDAYSGLLQNMRAIKRLDDGMTIARDAILLGIEYFDEGTGRVPNLLPYNSSSYEVRGHRILPSGEYYYTADATLLFFILAQRYMDETKDSGLASKILELFVKTLQRYRGASLESINGSPVLTENGLLACVPWHSWTDSKREIALDDLRVKDLTARVQREWQMEELRRARSPEEVWSLFNRPVFYLPEINALWIRALEAMVAMAEVNRVSSVNPEIMDAARGVLTNAKENYSRIFWNDRKKFLYDIVSLDLSLRDDTLGSCGIVAASLLCDLLPRDRLESIWTTARDNLLVSHRVTWLKGYVGELLPFGVTVKDYGERIYLGDEQYHGAVVWPRDTPLLIGLLERLGATDVIKGLLVSNLDHQMGEGVVFYNHELFSLPAGRNPSPVAEFANNPVPVKNPIQFWSQWVDPYLSYEI